MVLLNRELKQAGNPPGRRSIRWQGSSKLSERMNFLSEWYREDEQGKSLEMDEEAKHSIQEKLESALMRECQVRVQSWKNHSLHYYAGKIVEINPQTRTIVIDEPFGMKRLPVDGIAKIMLVG